jgi:AcrR family transcriptional regulator
MGGVEDVSARSARAAAVAPPRGAAARAARRDPQRTRAAILESALKEFARHGLGGARVDRIAANARANKRMLYYYFGDKEELFLAVLEESYARIRSAEQALDLEHLAPREALKRLVEFTWNYFLEHPEFMTLLNSENLHRGRHVSRSKRAREIQSPLIATLRAILERGERDGLFRPGIDAVQLYISIAAEGYFYLSNRYTLSQIFDSDLMKPAALGARARHITELVLNGVRK